MFNSFQQRLSSGAPQQIERDDFPLRGLVRCSKCDKALTAGWVQGRSKRYSRYWCFTKGCGGVGVSADGLEAHLHTLLDRVTSPAVDSLDVPPTTQMPYDVGSNALSIPRTTSQVLNIVYAGGSCSGGFYPQGMNGTIRCQ